MHHIHGNDAYSLFFISLFLFPSTLVFSVGILIQTLNFLIYYNPGRLVISDGICRIYKVSN